MRGLKDMTRQQGVLTALLVLLIVMLLTGCAVTASDSAICDGIDRRALARAAMVDAGPVSAREVLYVLDQLKAACGG